MPDQDKFALDAKLIRSTIYANNVIQRVTTRLLYGEAGLTLPQYLLLLLLREAGQPLPMSELAARAHVIKQAITSAYQRLHAKGLVGEVRDPRDRRVCGVVLTDEGHQLLTKLEPARRELYQEWLDPLAAEELTAALEVLEHVVATGDSLGKRGRSSSSSPAAPA